MERASLIAGHQLSSDLAVLAAAANAPLLGVTAAQVAWRRRDQLLPGRPWLLDTRYDTGHVLECASRRLVDVCAELRLDVTQPELHGTSMTALHRRWLEREETSAREKITVLNLRRALSTALVAAHLAGFGSWSAGPERQQDAGHRAGRRAGLARRSGVRRAAGGIKCSVTAS